MSSTAVVKKSYGAGDIKRRRPTATEMEHRRATIVELAREAQPVSVRGIYYRAVVAGLVPKNQNGYAQVQRQVLDLRRAGVLPWHWVVDTGRRAHWPVVERSAGAALRCLAATYRRDPWPEDGVRVELWCESESIAGILDPLRTEYSVPIFPIKGQTSETFVRDAATSYKRHTKVVVLYCGDYDPAGLQIGSQLAGKLRTFADESVSIDFRRVAIDDEQAQRIQMLGTPPKQDHWKEYDGSRHPFIGQAVEAEALDARTMRQMFATIIENVAFSTFGTDIFTEARARQAHERTELTELAEGWAW